MVVAGIEVAHHMEQEDVAHQVVHIRFQEVVAALPRLAIRTHFQRGLAEDRITPTAGEGHPLEDHLTTLEEEDPYLLAVEDHLSTTKAAFHLDSHPVTAEEFHPACHPEEVATADPHIPYQRPCQPSTNLP
jgi:hypothetical protein